MGGDCPRTSICTKRELVCVAYFANHDTQAILTHIDDTQGGYMADSKFQQIRELTKEMVTSPDTDSMIEIQRQIINIVNNMEADIDNIYLESHQQLERVSNILF